MVAPITNLGTKTIRIPATGTALFYEQKTRYKQAKPYNLVLPYMHDIDQIVNIKADGSTYTGPGWGADRPPFPVSFTGVQNRSYEQLRGKLYDQAALGVDFVEYRQSVSMIASTAVSLGKAAYAVKSLRFGDAAKHLRMKFIPKRVGVHKSFANNWLEFHFGWQPLIADIHDACEVLNNPVKSFTYERSRVREPYLWTQHLDFGTATRDERATGIVFAAQGARVKAITNTGLHTLDQLGLINPLSLAWEIVPFSFVVDWFVNVGGFISSLSDFAGMTIEDTWQTIGYKIDTTSGQYTKPGYSPTGFVTWNGHFRYMSRSTSLSGVSINVTRLKAPSVTRAATAISLLIQQLRK